MIRFVAYLVLIVQVFGQEGCIINIANLDPEPIVLTQNTYQFIYPPFENEEENRNITIPVGNTIIITCPGGFLSTDQGPESSTMYATCNLDSQLIYDDKILNFSSVNCSSDRLETIKFTAETCGINSQIIIVGYEISLDINFVPLITVCFDLVSRSPLWTRYHLSQSIGLREIGTERYLEDSSIYNLNITFQQLYNVDYQRKIINSLVGLDEQAHEYIDYRPFYLEPLSQPIAFMYRTQLNATAHYFNTVPQWVLPGGYYNWGRTETSMLQFVRQNQVDLEVYTGTYGVCTLPHVETGDDIDIYLYVDENNNKAIPVPELFWKVIFDPFTRRATTFITINNPYQTNLTKNILCDDISDGISWLSWIGKDNIYQGYSYACTYHELKETITYLPELDVIGILV